jgi:hypothetical protein
MVGTSMLSRLTGTVMIKGPNSRKPLECSNAITPTASKTTGGMSCRAAPAHTTCKVSYFL